MKKIFFFKCKYFLKQAYTITQNTWWTRGFLVSIFKCNISSKGLHKNVKSLVGKGFLCFNFKWKYFLRRPTQQCKKTSWKKGFLCFKCNFFLKPGLHNSVKNLVEKSFFVSTANKFLIINYYFHLGRHEGSYSKGKKNTMISTRALLRMRKTYHRYKIGRCVSPRNIYKKSRKEFKRTKLRNQ